MRRKIWSFDPLGKGRGRRESPPPATGGKDNLPLCHGAQWKSVLLGKDGTMQVFWQDERGEGRAANPAAHWRDGKGNILAAVPARARHWEGPEADWQVVMVDFILPCGGFIAH